MTTDILIRPTEYKIMKSILTVLCFHWIATQSTLLVAQDNVRPDEIQFRRQAVVRMGFDASQNIPLASLRPA